MANKPLLIFLMLFLCMTSCASTTPEPDPDPIETKFETMPADPGNFTLGTSPFTATFGGDATVFTVAIPSLYVAPSHNAWGLQTSGMGTIQFNEDPAAEVSVQVRATNNADATITAKDPNGNEIDSLPIPSDNFQTFVFSGAIQSLELINLTDGEFAVIGEFNASI